MPKYFLETSAFLKRYKNEAGSDIVNNLFNNIKELFYLDVIEQNQADSVKKLLLPDRLINPLYGREELNQRLQEMATAAPSIEQVWEITKQLPSLSKLLSEERDNE